MGTGQKGHPWGDNAPWKAGGEGSLLPPPAGSFGGRGGGLGCLWMCSGSLLPGFPWPTLTATSGLCCGGTGARELSCLQCCFLKSRPPPLPCEQHGGLAGGSRG